MLKPEDMVQSKVAADKVEGRESFKRLRFKYEGELPIIEVCGFFRVYINRFKEEKTLSLAINTMDTDIEFLALEEKLCELAGKSLGCEPKLVKENKKGEKVVYCKVLPNSFGIPPTIYNERLGCHEKFVEYLNRPFKSKCKIIIKYAFKGNATAFMIYAEDITNLKMIFW